MRMLTVTQLEVVHRTDNILEPLDEFDVSFGYKRSFSQSSGSNDSSGTKAPANDQIQESKFMSRSSSFSQLSGAALSANPTLANTNMCNGLFGEEILPGLDSPNSFRKLTSSPSLLRLDSFSSSPGDPSPLALGRYEFMSSQTDLETSSFLHAMDINVAGGAAGEDRVQAVCPEGNEWLFCGVYDGFNGRDAADFLAVTLYEYIAFNLQQLEWDMKQVVRSPTSPFHISPLLVSGLSTSSIANSEKNSSELFRDAIMNCLTHALAQAESEFMQRVEEEMVERPDLVSVGSCVLAMFLHESHMYIMSLGDSRGVLATRSSTDSSLIQAIQLTDIHSVDNPVECHKIVEDHPDDPSPITDGRVKGKLKVTRALGVGYLKKKNLNDALMGILRVRNLIDPPYIYTNPLTMIREVSENDLFVVLGSDGLFDFFSNMEVVELVHQFIRENPSDDPAKYLVKQLVLRAASQACMSTEELSRVPFGRRRKYHDDVTVVVIILGNKQRKTCASTSL